MQNVHLSDYFSFNIPPLPTGAEISKTFEVVKSFFNFESMKSSARHFASFCSNGYAILGFAAVVAVGIASVIKSRSKAGDLWQDPAKALKHLQQNTPPSAVKTFELMINGVLRDMHARRDESPDADRQNSRTALIKAFFEKYPGIEPSFIGQHLTNLLSAWGCGGDNLPIFSAIIDHCPGIENQLKSTLYNAYDKGVTGYIQKILTKQPALKAELSDFMNYCQNKDVTFLKWITDNYFDSLQPEAVAMLMSHLVFINTNQEGQKLFAEVAARCPELPEERLKGLIAFSANFPVMFELVLQNFKGLDRGKIAKMLDNSIFQSNQALIDKYYPVD
jgi:hypothetical protein